ncbi:ClpP/crotonase-like domain-containing protein [Neohortaea acidophila]|uniref:ClpP/crotonase-like domain-containing protein n=1 Tax=Neohortaea acidophila TaxID=245834 RepID=A0A6A6PRM8_9PEZI|nr:ClpP/crotonase-like domain-containing protein [Neohortaea acidophila]KAF2482113.1 ClpP/crotonase-like domain-containing protein [Neohortaea acidophila]
MLRSVQRQAARHAFTHHRPTTSPHVPVAAVTAAAASSRACYSSLQSAVKLSSIPAPHSGSITIVSLNRPKARNAISQQLLSELSGVVEGLQREGGKGSTRALILTSESDAAFCAGADLKERLSMSPAEVHTFLTALRRAFATLAALPIPTISAISSTAFGGGLEMALATHFRVFASTASVALPETRLAIIPGAGGTFRLPALVGPTRARDLILTGRRVSGAEAYFIGLCDRLVEVTAEEEKAPGVARGKVYEQAVSLAREICEGGPIAIRAAMQAVEGWRQGEAAENMAYEMVLPTDDRKEALRAFGEKRKPVFKGR